MFAKFLISLVCFSFSFVLLGQELKIYTEDSPPTNYLKDGKAAGQSVETVREIQRRVNNRSPISVVP